MKQIIAGIVLSFVFGCYRPPYTTPPRFTRARISQLMDLLLIPPEILEEILFRELPVGAQPLSERTLREAMCGSVD